MVPDNDDDYYTTRKSTDPYDDYYDDPGEELGLLPGVKRIEHKNRLPVTDSKVIQNIIHKQHEQCIHIAQTKYL